MREKLSIQAKRAGVAALVALMMLSVASCVPTSANDRHKRQVDQLMEKMTLEQKVAQIFAISVVKNSSPERTALNDSLIKRGVGSLILMRGPLEQFIDRANELQGYAEIPLLVTLDAEWGASMRFDEYPLFPRQWELGHIENAEDLIYEMGRNVGKELKDLNIYVNFAPVVDLASGKDGLSRIESRQFSSDHRKVARYGLSYMKGMQDEGICACGKHFPGFSGTRPDSHYSLPVSFNSRERIDSVELYPYKKMIEAGLKMVMMGHLSLPSVDSTGTPMSISRKGVTGLLKEELGFNGLVITDALQMGAISNQFSPLESNLMAYRAGVDILLWPGEILETMNAIEDSIKCGVYPLEELDAKVRKILELKAEFGFFDKGYDPIVTDVPKKVLDARSRDEELIRKIAKRLNDCGYGDPIPDWSDPTVVMEKMAK